MNHQQYLFYGHFIYEKVESFVMLKLNSSQKTIFAVALHLLCKPKWILMKCMQCVPAAVLCNTFTFTPPHSASSIQHWNVLSSWGTKITEGRSLYSPSIPKIQKCSVFEDHDVPPIKECFAIIEQDAKHFWDGRAAERATRCDLCSAAGIVGSALNV